MSAAPSSMQARLESLDLAAALAPGPRAFAARYAEALSARIGSFQHKLDDEVQALAGDGADAVRARYRAATDPVERYLWARLGKHAVQEGAPLEDAIARAGDDLLSFSATLHLY